MKTDFHNRVYAVFTETRLLPADERAAYLDRVCGTDAELRRRVDLLVEHHEQIGEFLQESARPANAEIGKGEKPGDLIGQFKLLQQIGEGGWGIVFMAEQEIPVRRRVAIKIIKPGMDTKSVVARFEAERQALAMMDHPSIAKIFEAGTTESGRPYFVMELIRGIKITEYCDQNALTTEDRLKLFLQVCQAIQHAHQKGIIHRDIKPSNILVTTSAEDTVLPVVIDFGIAKATTNQRLTDKTFFTAFEMLIGTPAYMSPEQAALSHADVDTRTDIYSLGVLLYELLTGSTPFEKGESLKAGIDEIRRMILEKEPLCPSTRLKKLTVPELKTVAVHRRTEVPELIRTVHGDLDWIAMKALEKERTRRYATANALALDVQRFLDNEIISARPPSKAYKFKKTVLRHKLLFTGVGVVALLLIASLIIVSASLANEKRSRREAEAAKAEAEAESVRRQQATKFLEEMLNGVGPSVALGRDTTMLREILDQTTERVGKEMSNQPVVEAELRDLIGRLQFEIGNYARAEEMNRAELKIDREHFGNQSSQTAASLNNLGLALDKQKKFAEAESALREALDIRRRLFGNENADVATSLNNLGIVLRHQRRLSEAEALSRDALLIRTKLFGAQSLEVADTLHNLTVVLGDEGKQTECESTAREMLAIRRKLLGNEHPLVASSLSDMAWAESGSGKLHEAEILYRECLEMRLKLLGKEHPDTLAALQTLATTLGAEGKWSQVEMLQREELDIRRKLAGNEDPRTMYVLRNIGLTLKTEGKLLGAESIFREALNVSRKNPGGSEDSEALMDSERLVDVLLAQNKFSEAEQFLNDLLTPDFIAQPSSANFLNRRIDIRGRQGRWAEATADAKLVSEHQPLNYGNACILAALLIKTGDLQRYEQLCRQLLKTFGDTTNIYIADQVAKACLFAPTKAVDLQLISDLVDKAVTRGVADDNSMQYFEVCKAMSEYREGEFAQAVEWSEKVSSRSSTQAQDQAYAIQAMAEWQLGRTDMARTALAKATALAPALDDWLAQLYASISLDEANKLIQNGAKPALTPEQN